MVLLIKKNMSCKCKGVGRKISKRGEATEKRPKKSKEDRKITNKKH